MLREARALMLAAAAVTLSVISHGLAGGAQPDVVPLIIIGVLACVVIRPWTRRQLGMPTLLAVLGAGQLVLHFAFEGSAAVGAADALAQHHHGHHASPLWMICAHAAATLVIGLVLRHGEAVLWRLWSLWRPVPGVPYAVVVPSGPPPAGNLPALHMAAVRRAIQARAPPAAPGY